MRRTLTWLTGLLLLAAPLIACAADVDTYARRIGPLIDPAKLATLRERGANPRVQKYVAHLAEARQAGVDETAVVKQAVALVGLSGESGSLTAAAMLRNLTIAEQLGCLTPESVAAMRRGGPPTVGRGPYAGDKLSVDHIIPRAVAPELDRVIANLELMPLRVNVRKNSKVGPRQIDLAHKLFNAGMLSAQRLRKIELIAASHRRGSTPPGVSDLPTIKRQPAALTHWITSRGGKRHNSTCRYFKKSKGRFCGPNEGVACKICGG